MRKTTIAAQAIRGLPLCEKYSAIYMVTVSARLVSRRGDAVAALLLGLGALARGVPDFLGAWPASDLGRAPARRIVDELVERGIRSTNVVITGASEELSAALRRSFPRASFVFPIHCVAQVISSGGPVSGRGTIELALEQVCRGKSQEHANAVLEAIAASARRGSPVEVGRFRAAIEHCQGFYALPRCERDRVRRTEAEVWVLRQGVSKALARHGSFADAEAAVALVDAWFGDAERRARRRRLEEDRLSWLAAA